MITINLDNKTETQFNKLLKLSKMNFSVLVNSMLTYRINELNKGIQKIEFDFLGYEKKYNIKTKDFYKKYSEGRYKNESENNDFMIWSAEFEAYSEFRQELKQLQ